MSSLLLFGRECFNDAGKIRSIHRSVLYNEIYSALVNIIEPSQTSDDGNLKNMHWVLKGRHCGRSVIKTAYVFGALHVHMPTPRALNLTAV